MFYFMLNFEESKLYIDSSQPLSLPLLLPSHARPFHTTIIL